MLDDRSRRRTFSQRTYLLLQEIRQTNERLAREDNRVRPMRDAVEPKPGIYATSPVKISSDLAEYLDGVQEDAA